MPMDFDDEDGPRPVKKTPTLPQTPEKKGDKGRRLIPIKSLRDWSPGEELQQRIDEMMRPEEPKKST